MRRLNARWFVHAVLAVSIVALMSPHRGVAESNPPDLALETTVRGDRATWMRVSLPSDVSVSSVPYDNPDVEVTSEGRLAGIALVKDVPWKDEFLFFVTAVPDRSICVENDRVDEIEAAILGFGNCSRFRYWVRGEIDKFDAETGRWLIPAGTYLLHLIAEEPTTVTIRFRGLSGSADFAPTAPTSMQLYENESLGPDVPMNMVYWTGAQRRMDSPGLVWSGSWIITKHHVQSYHASCNFWGETQTSDLTFTPAFCNRFLFDDGIVAPGRWGEYFDGWTDPVSGNVSAGWSYVNIGEVEKIGGITLWLTYGG